MQDSYSPKKYIKEFLETNGYVYCELCGLSNSLGFSVHHIIFRSELGKKQDMHNKLNLILLCYDCHNNFHTHKQLRNRLVEKRKLNELFGRNFINNNKKYYEEVCSTRSF